MVVFFSFTFYILWVCKVELLGGAMRCLHIPQLELRMQMVTGSLYSSYSQLDSLISNPITIYYIYDINLDIYALICL